MKHSFYWVRWMVPLLRIGCKRFPASSKGPKVMLKSRVSAPGPLPQEKENCEQKLKAATDKLLVLKHQVHFLRAMGGVKGLRHHACSQ